MSKSDPASQEATDPLGTEIVECALCHRAALPERLDEHDCEPAAIIDSAQDADSAVEAHYANDERCAVCGGPIGLVSTFGPGGERVCSLACHRAAHSQEDY